MLLSHRINFKEKIASDKEEYYEIKELIHWKDIMILNMCAPNNRASKYMKLKEEVDKSTTIAGDSSTPVSANDRTRQEISKDMEELSNRI